jgi:hypothetical protein
MRKLFVIAFGGSRMAETSVQHEDCNFVEIGERRWWLGVMV